MLSCHSAFIFTHILTLLLSTIYGTELPDVPLKIYSLTVTQYDSRTGQRVSLSGCVELGQHLQPVPGSNAC